METLGREDPAEDARLSHRGVRPASHVLCHAFVVVETRKLGRQFSTRLGNALGRLADKRPALCLGVRHLEQNDSHRLHVSKATDTRPCINIRKRAGQPTRTSIALNAAIASAAASAALTRPSWMTTST